jgi:tetratricopeptide (TPR) repeat protein
LNLGRTTEATAATHKAIELDPLSASAWNNLGSAFSIDPNHYREAREAFDRALEINPESSFAKINLVTLELLEGHAQQALSVARTAGEVWRQTGVAMAEHAVGNAAESQRALDDLIAKYAHDSAYQVADVYAWRGESDKAFEWLERAYEQHDAGLSSIKTDPVFKPLWTDARFAALLKKVGLPP